MMMMSGKKEQEAMATAVVPVAPGEFLLHSSHPASLMASPSSSPSGDVIVSVNIQPLGVILSLYKLASLKDGQVSYFHSFWT